MLGTYAIPLLPVFLHRYFKGLLVVSTTLLVSRPLAGQQEPADHGHATEGIGDATLQGYAATHHAQCQQGGRLHQWDGGNHRGL